jgi:hypothetical protein
MNERLLTTSDRDKLKSLWFARWISMCYADTFVSNERREDGSLIGLPVDKGGMSVLNREDGKWYAEQLVHFENVVFKEWLKAARAKRDLEVTLDMISDAQKVYADRKQKIKEDKFFLAKEIKRKEDLQILKEIL